MTNSSLEHWRAARPGPRYFNPMGGLHGGWYATLLDSAVGCAVHSTLSPGRGHATLELKVNLVRAIGPDVPLVRAEGRAIHVGRQVATADWSARTAGSTPTPAPPA